MDRQANETATVRVTLSHEGIQYTYDQPWSLDIYDDFQDALAAIKWMYTEGNYSCDCNKTIFVDRYCDIDLFPDEEDVHCGDDIALSALTLIDPNGDEHPIDVTPLPPPNPPNWMLVSAIPSWAKRRMDA